jgi:transcription antitermination factor NusG
LAYIHSLTVTEVAKLQSGTNLTVVITTPNLESSFCHFADSVELSLPERHWYAVCVSPRHEKVVATHLEMRGPTCFLPVYRSVRRWKDRRKQLDMVLFPGYVFVNLDLRHRLPVLQAPGVLRFVTFQGHPAPLPDSELKSLAVGLAQSARTEPHPYLRRGRRVRVVRGPLANTEGILVRRKERFRLVLSIDLIMRSVMLDVDEADVEPL